jgi:hypothetical protein
MKSKSLHEIGVEFGTDKATYHMYMDTYEHHLSRVNISSFLEIGVQAGYSLQTWRKWLSPNALIDGWDIEECKSVDGCSIFKVDQSSRAQMSTNVRPDGYDVIIDDGGHTPRLMETSFSYLFSFCKIYIIEDLHAWWLGHKEDSDSISTAERLMGVKSQGWSSQYGLPSENSYISKFANVAELFIRGNPDSPESMTAIIYNMEKFDA